MHRLTARRRWTRILVPFAFAALLTGVLFAAPQSYAGGDGSGGCVAGLDPTCTVGVVSRGTGHQSDRGGVHVDPLGCQNTDPVDGVCNPCPAKASSGDLGLSGVCAAYLHNQQCYTIKLDTLGGWVGGASYDLQGAVNLLSVAKVAALNRTLTTFGCPPVVTSATLAQQAFKSIRFPHPSGHRSPSESQLYNGFPFTWVNLWTFYWTDNGTWRTLTATASAAGVSATVTATPVHLVFDPGNGAAAVSCPGPGRPWTDADGDGSPSGGACAYQYRMVTSLPITSTQSILWKITWVGSRDTSGELPRMRTSTSGRLQVMQIQVVNR